jgi:hypothetical protein
MFGCMEVSDVITRVGMTISLSNCRWPLTFFLDLAMSW